MELLKKLELSMEDVRMLQAEAKRDALRRTHRALTAKILRATLHVRMCPPKTKQTARTADKTASTSAIRIRRWDAHWQQPCRE